MLTGEKDDGGSVAVVVEGFQAPVEVGVTDELIAGIAKRLKGATADTATGYEVVRQGVAECRRHPQWRAFRCRASCAADSP